MVADDPDIRPGEDRVRIHPALEHEVKHWTEEFGCTADELRAAVQAVGPVARKVREYLKAEGESCIRTPQ